MSALLQFNSELEEKKTSTRRNFFTDAICSLMSIITAVLGVPATAYLLVPARSRNTEDWVDAGEIDKIASTQPVLTSFRRNHVDGWKTTNQKLTAWVV